MDGGKNRTSGITLAMKDAGANTHRPKNILDALASRPGIWLALGTLVTLCFGAGLYTQSVVRNLDNTHELFEASQVGNGYVAMSDVQRLLLVVQTAVYEGEMSEERLRWKVARRMYAAEPFVVELIDQLLGKIRD